MHSVELMLMRGGEECQLIAREIPDAGYYSWNVPPRVGQSNRYKEGVWLRGNIETNSDFEKRMEMQVRSKLLECCEHHWRLWRDQSW